MTTYVLVHGAWGGSHQFIKVRRRLQALGQEVFTPSLTGIGERVHLVSPQVNLSTHISDVVNTILYQDLNDIVLLGHSYGGLVIAGALNHIGDRVAHLVFLDAFVPENGDNASVLLKQAQSPAPMHIGQPWLVPAAIRSFADPRDDEWVTPRRTPQPIASLLEPVTLNQPIEAGAYTLTYIKAADDTPAGDGPFWQAAARVRGRKRWDYREIQSNHMIPTNRPEELTDILMEFRQA